MKKFDIMTKGHNQGKTNDADPKNKTKGQDRKLSDSQKDKSPNEGSTSEEDQSGGKKDRM